MSRQQTAAHEEATVVQALRPLGVTELLDTAVRAAWSQRRAVLVISVPMAIVVTALRALLQYATLSDTDAGSVLPAGIGGLLVPVLGGTVLAGLIAPAISDDLFGRHANAGACLRRVGRLALPLAGLAILVSVAEGIGLVLLVAGGVWLWGLWAVAAPALVNERLGMVGALRRSSVLVTGVFWRTWGVRALGWLVTYLIGLLASAPFQVVAAAVTGADPFAVSGVDHAGTYITIVTIGSLVGALVTMPIAAAIDVLIYLDLRMRREGMDIVMNLPPLPPPASVDAHPAPQSVGPLAPFVQPPW